MTQNILVLVDLDDENSCRKVLPTAIDYARHSGAQLHVLNVVPDGMYKMTVVAQLVPDDYEQRLLDDAKKRLAALIAKQAADDIELQQSVRLGSVYKEALRLARDVNSDLIVMGSHRPEAKDYLLGSNASQIVRHAACSVWVVRD